MLCASAGAQAHSSAHAAAKAGLAGKPLGLDQAVFWDGGTLDGNVQNAALCGTAGECPSYSLSIVHGGARLRVGIDSPVRSNTFAVEILDASGAVLASDENSNQFNSEAMLLHPDGGVYTVRVRPVSVQQGSYRMRAKLEAMLPEDLPSSATAMPLLPNLKVVPPYEFGFIAPANPLNGVYPPDTVNPPLDVAGIHPISCSADEMAPVALGGGGASKCLRFTSGPINLGAGIYDMRFDLIGDFIAGAAQLAPQEALSRIVIGPMRQVIHYSDGSTQERDAGTYSFHPVHAHFHDDYVLSFRLYAVHDYASGALERVGEGSKSGFCPADQLWGDWYSFDQGYEVPGGDEPLGNCSSPANGVMGLSVGWGDVYRWQRPGMYVEFAGQPNGRYVVQSRVDEQDHILESSEADNAAYAYVQVENDVVLLLERGWGESPWDPGKTVFAGTGPAQRAPMKLDATTPDSGEMLTASESGSGGSLPAALLLPLLVAGLCRRRMWRV
ncbi:MAG: lysyl oxidase family protein [Stagnimonas sp.]|nr:lysyl oxidase family protein [Stagnimonas sp.]